MQLRRGFTLIELLVVIAIIGILASIVMVSLSGARGSSKDVSVKQQMSSMRTAAELYYFANGGHFVTADVYPDCTTELFADDGTNMKRLIEATIAAAPAANVRCAASVVNKTWAVAAALPTAGNFWCVDSTGTSRGVTTGGLPYVGTITGSPAAQRALTPLDARAVCR